MIVPCGALDALRRYEHWNGRIGEAETGGNRQDSEKLLFQLFNDVTGR